MSECVLSELGAYNLLQARPCLVADLLCVAAGTTIRVYSVLSGIDLLNVRRVNCGWIGCFINQIDMNRLASVKKLTSFSNSSIDRNITNNFRTIGDCSSRSRWPSYQSGRQSKCLLSTDFVRSRWDHSFLVGWRWYATENGQAGSTWKSLRSEGNQKGNSHRCRPRCKSQLWTNRRTRRIRKWSKTRNCSTERSSTVFILVSWFPNQHSYSFHSFDETYTADKHWSLNGKATRVAFLHSDHIRILHIKTRKVRKIRLSAKLGDPLCCDFAPREESVMVAFKSGQIRIFSNFTKDEGRGLFSSL